MKPLVRIYPLTIGAYTAQIYAGLYDLEASGEISLELTSRPETLVEERNGDYGFSDNLHLFYLELVPGPGKPAIRICYDMMDNWGISSISGLEHCHHYFKRSFDRSALGSDLPAWTHEHPEWRDKIHPYGLNYPCKSHFERHRTERALHFMLATRPSLRRNGGNFARGLRHLRNSLRPREAEWSIKARDLEVSPDHPSENAVLLQTRLFEPWDELTRQINDERVRLVTALRSEFGPRFVGGFVDNELARRTCPHLITREAQGRRGYLDLVRRCRIVVFSRGLVDSTGWRFGELLAASRCIVTEPIRYELPEPLLEGRNIMSFQFPDMDRCLSACDALLSDPDRARTMQRENQRYYQENVKPAAIVRNTLNIALGRAKSATLSA